MTKSEIKKLYKEYHVPKHVIAHMEGVAKICGILADKCTEKGLEIDKKLLISAAKLHDTLRVCDFKNLSPEQFQQKVTKKDLEVWQDLRKKYYKIGHERAIAKVLKTMDQSKLANLILKHDFYLIDKLKTWEEKILYYADKRVDRDQIVSLKTRFKEGRKRNNEPGDDFSHIESIEKKILLLEKDLVRKIGKMPF